MIPRRAFLSGLVGIVAAPAIVSRANIMAVRSIARFNVVWKFGLDGWTVWTYDFVTGEWMGSIIHYDRPDELIGPIVQQWPTQVPTHGKLHAARMGRSPRPDAIGL